MEKAPEARQERDCRGHFRGAVALGKRVASLMIEKHPRNFLYYCRLAAVDVP